MYIANTANDGILNNQKKEANVQRESTVCKFTKNIPFLMHRFRTWLAKWFLRKNLLLNA